MKVVKLLVFIMILLCFVSRSYPSAKLSLNASVTFYSSNSAPMVSGIVHFANSGNIPFKYNLFDAEKDLCAIHIQYKGGYKGNNWIDATFSGIKVDVEPDNSIEAVWHSGVDIPNAVSSELYWVRIAAVDAVHPLGTAVWVEYGPINISNSSGGDVVDLKFDSIEMVDELVGGVIKPVVKLGWVDDVSIDTYYIYWYNDMVQPSAWDEVGGVALGRLSKVGDRYFWVDDGTDPEMNGFVPGDGSVKKRFYKLRGLKR